MSQVVSEMHDTAEFPEGAVDPAAEFEYRPVPPLAPITLFLGICGVAGLMGLPGMTISLVGTLTGLVCLWQIRRSQDELGGRVVASIGLALCITFLVSGGALHSYIYATEVPEGYQRVSFNSLAKEMPKMTEEGLQFPPEVAELDGKPIFIKGYMFPTQQLTGKTEFVLVKDTGQCCFGGNPKLSDMVVVKFKDGMTVDHKEQTLVSVAGTFHAGIRVQSGELTAIYSLDGTHFK
jgi:hypothetical protein